MNIWTICGAVIICLVFIISFGKWDNKSTIMVASALCIMIIVSSLENAIPIFNYVNELIHINSESGEYLSILIKSLGIALISSYTVGLCRSCNQDNIAFAVELFAKTEMIVLCLPVIRSLLELAVKSVD